MTFEEAKPLAQQGIKMTHQFKEEDKQCLIKGCMDCKSLTRLQQYLCNALLKYEGMSLSKMK